VVSTPTRGVFHIVGKLTDFICIMILSLDRFAWYRGEFLPVQAIFSISSSP